MIGKILILLLGMDSRVQGSNSIMTQVQVTDMRNYIQMLEVRNKNVSVAVMSNVKFQSSKLSCDIIQIHNFIYLFDRENDICPICCLISQMVTRIGPCPGQSWELGTPFRSYTSVKGPQVLGSTSSAFPITLAESWIRNIASMT